MSLFDTGPMVAIVNDRDADHQQCVDALRRLKPPLLTTWVVVGEAMYLAGRIGGWRTQQAMWRLLLKDEVEIVHLSPALARRSYELMEKYHDTPMDLADASLVALAETRNLRRVFTLDSDFRVYRLNGRATFEILP